jgi:hypothetical protein
LSRVVHGNTASDLVLGWKTISPHQRSHDAGGKFVENVLSSWLLSDGAQAEQYIAA